MNKNQNRDAFSIRIKKRLKRIPKRVYRFLTNKTDYDYTKLFYHAVRKFTSPKIEVILTNHGAYRYRERFDEWKTNASLIQKQCKAVLTRLLKKKLLKRIEDGNKMKWYNTSEPSEIYVFDVEYDYDKHTKSFKLVTCYKLNQI